MITETADTSSSLGETRMHHDYNRYDHFVESSPALVMKSYVEGTEAHDSIRPQSCRHGLGQPVISKCVKSLGELMSIGDGLVVPRDREECEGR